MYEHHLDHQKSPHFSLQRADCFYRGEEPQGYGVPLHQVSGPAVPRKAVSLTPPKTDIAQATASSNRILSLRDDRTEPDHSGQKLEKGEGGVEIEFRNVHFKYPTRDVQVFAGLNMKVC